MITTPWTYHAYIIEVIDVYTTLILLADIDAAIVITCDFYLENQRESIVFVLLVALFFI